MQSPSRGRNDTNSCLEYSTSSQDTEDSIIANAQEKYVSALPLNNEVQVCPSLLGNDLLLPTQSTLPEKDPDIYCIADFAEELAETIVSMAAEIAAICLTAPMENNPGSVHGKEGMSF